MTTTANKQGNKQVKNQNKQSSIKQKTDDDSDFPKTHKPVTSSQNHSSANHGAGAPAPSGNGGNGAGKKAGTGSSGFPLAPVAGLPPEMSASDFAAIYGSTVPVDLLATAEAVALSTVTWPWKNEAMDPADRERCKPGSLSPHVIDQFSKWFETVISRHWRGVDPPGPGFRVLFERALYAGCLARWGFIPKSLAEVEQEKKALQRKEAQMKREQDLEYKRERAARRKYNQLLKVSRCPKVLDYLKLIGVKFEYSGFGMTDESENQVVECLEQMAHGFKTVPELAAHLKSKYDKAVQSERKWKTYKLLSRRLKADTSLREQFIKAGWYKEDYDLETENDGMNSTVEKLLAGGFNPDVGRWDPPLDHGSIDFLSYLPK